MLDKQQNCSSNQNSHLIPSPNILSLLRDDQTFPRKPTQTPSATTTFRRKRMLSEALEKCRLAGVTEWWTWRTNLTFHRYFSSWLWTFLALIGGASTAQPRKGDWQPFKPQAHDRNNTIRCLQSSVFILPQDSGKRVSKGRNEEKMDRSHVTTRLEALFRTVSDS